MGKRLVVKSAGVIGWQECQQRVPRDGEIKIRPKFGVEKHGTMAAFVKGYGNERGRWDPEFRIHRNEGLVWDYPIPLGNMQFGTTESGAWVAWWGPFEEEAIVSESSLLNMKDVQWQDAAMQDPGEFAFGALRDGGVRIGDTVAIFGLGAIGLAAVQLAKVAGASKVFALDPLTERRAIAERYGAIPIDPVSTDAGLELRQATGMAGVDIVIEYSGAWQALQAALRGVAYGGTIACGAFPPPHSAGLDLGAEAHMNRAKIVFTRACSNPNPDHPRWHEDRIRETVWDFIQRGALKGERIVDAPALFAELHTVYPEIALHPDRHIKLSVRY